LTRIIRYKKKSWPVGHEITFFPPACRSGLRLGIPKEEILEIVTTATVMDATTSGRLADFQIGGLAGWEASGEAVR